MLFEKTVFFPIPHTKLVPPKNPKMEVKKNDCRYPVPSQQVTKHSHIRYPLYIKELLGR